MKLVWTTQAIRDLLEIRAYVERDNPKAASDLAKRIRRATARLARHPESGRRGKLAGIRELVIARTPYLVPYRLHGDRIELLRVLHGRRLSPAGD